MSTLDDFTAGYTTAMLELALSDYGDPAYDAMLDDLSDEDRQEIKNDCRNFFEANRQDIEAYCDVLESNYRMAGQDFYLTRNRHGAGFWDRSYADDYIEIGARLTKDAHVYGETNYTTDDWYA